MPIEMVGLSMRRIYRLALAVALFILFFESMSTLISVRQFYSLGPNKPTAPATVVRGNRSVSPTTSGALTFSVESCNKTTSVHENIKTTRFGIPLILHQMDKEKNIAAQYEQNVKHCRAVNPDFMHIIWSDEDVVKFINKTYPQYKNLLSLYTSRIQKSDVFRILILYHFGGIYMDLDVDCKLSLSKGLDALKTSCILDRENEMQTRLLWNMDYTVMNSVMACRPKHAFFRYILMLLVSGKSHGSTLQRTGPHFLMRHFNIFSSTATANNRVDIAESYVFNPLPHWAKAGQYNSMCRDLNSVKGNRLKYLGCLAWKSFNATTATKRSLGVHQFLGLGYPWNFNKITRRADPCTFHPHVFRHVVT